MKIFILILVLYSQAGGTVSEQFSFEENCEKAGKAAYDKWNNWANPIYYICVEK